MSEAGTETITVNGGRASNGSRPAERPVTVTQSHGAGPAIKTPLGAAPILPLLMIGLGAYLLWFMSKYWRGSGPAVWPSYPIKSALQGKGLPPPQPAPAAALQVTSYETGVQAQVAAAGQGGSAAGEGGGGPVPPGASETLIIRAVLARIGAPQTSQNIDSMANWIRHETPWPPVARYNPMNTTLSEPGATNYNSVGVKNYTSWAQGIEATAQTLLGGYPCIVARFRTGAGVCGTGCSADFLKWSGGGYGSVC